MANINFTFTCRECEAEIIVALDEVDAGEVVQVGFLVLGSLSRWVRIKSWRRPQLELEGDLVVTTKLAVFSNTQRVEKLDRLESLKEAGNAMMDGR